MSIATVSCRAQFGLSAPPVQVEVSLNAGLPVFSMVGLPATVVRESKERVRAALLHSHFEFPAGRITVSLAPADLPKSGGRFDLPIALGILMASGQLRVRRAGRELGRIEFFGELGLSGELRPVSGMFLAAAHATRAGHDVILPAANADEVSVLVQSTVAAGMRRTFIFPARHLLSVCAHLDGSAPLPPLETGEASGPTAGRDASEPSLDLRDVRGQTLAKRALVIAAAGSHSVLMIGPPGVGKSMLARRLPGLLPPLSESESLEVAAIASASGCGFQPASFGRRPVRTPHHTASAVALVGGGSRARPGEISLAHRGVLFLDELLEYDRRALEALREPLESGVVHVTRAALRAEYPAEFQLVAAMNPCPCGRLGDPGGQCRCTPPEVSRYRARVSGPLLERLDIHLEMPRVQVGEFGEPACARESSAMAASRVARARDRQVRRQGVCNARLDDARIEQHCSTDPNGHAVLERAVQQFGFSARARQRILKLARTIADLEVEDAARISAAHVSEAISYRLLDRRTG